MHVSQALELNPSKKKLKSTSPPASTQLPTPPPSGAVVPPHLFPSLPSSLSSPDHPTTGSVSPPSHESGHASLPYTMAQWPHCPQEPSPCLPLGLETWDTTAYLSASETLGSFHPESLPEPAPLPLPLFLPPHFLQTSPNLSQL